MAHERLTEPRVTMESLLVKLRSFSNLPAFLDLCRTFFDSPASGNLVNWNLFPEHNFDDAEIEPPTHEIFYNIALQNELRSQVNNLVKAGMETNRPEFRITEPFDPMKYE